MTENTQNTVVPSDEPTDDEVVVMTNTKLNDLRAEMRAIKAEISLEQHKAQAGLHREKEIEVLINKQAENSFAQKQCTQTLNAIQDKKRADGAARRRKEIEEEAARMTPGMLEFLVDDPEYRCRLISRLLGALQSADIFGESYYQSVYTKLQMEREATGGGDVNDTAPDQHSSTEEHFNELSRQRERVLVLRHYFEAEFDRAYVQLDIQHMQNPPKPYYRSDQQVRIKAKENDNKRAEEAREAYMAKKGASGSTALLLEGKVVTPEHKAEAF
jgi:hypothetical protein